MKHRFINEFKEGEAIESVYLVREKSFDKAKNGSSYISLELMDKTGMVNGRKWDASKNLFDSFKVDDFVVIKGRVEIYRKYPQLNLDSICRIDDSEADASLYIPTVDKNRDKMLEDFLSNIGQVKNPDLKQLLHNIFSNKDMASKFKDAPAATDFHHPYLGGLLEHSLSCVELAVLLGERYAGIDIDLLVCGAALHDIGKIEELSYKRSFYYTDKGRLVGHIVLGVNIVDGEIRKIPGFSEELRNLILHIILSHHGEQEWGSPKRPMCIEAIALHHIDNLDAKINGFMQFVNTYNDPYSSWTKHSKMFKEFLYKRSVAKNEEVAYEEKG
ncbi:MAG: HD domain-containing protein [Candidatus Omnitrophota bacterium]